MLCLFISHPSLTSHFIHISMQCLHFCLQFPLGSSNGLVLACQPRQLFIGVGQFSFCLTPGPVCLLQKGFGMSTQTTVHWCRPVQFLPDAWTCLLAPKGFWPLPEHFALNEPFYQQPIMHLWQSPLPVAHLPVSFEIGGSTHGIS